MHTYRPTALVTALSVVLITPTMGCHGAKDAPEEAVSAEGHGGSRSREGIAHDDGDAPERPSPDARGGDPPAGRTQSRDREEESAGPSASNPTVLGFRTVHRAKPDEAGFVASLSTIAGSSAADVWFFGSRGVAVHFDGKRFSKGLSAKDPSSSLIGSVFVEVDGELVPDPRTGYPTIYAAWSNSSGEAVAVWRDVQRLNGDRWELDRSARRALRALPSGPTGRPPLLTDVWMSDDGVIIAVGQRGAVLRFDGGRWRQDRVPTSASLEGVWGRSSSDVYAVGGGGTLLHFDGSRWTRFETHTRGALLEVTGRPDGRVWVGGERGASGTIHERTLVPDPVLARLDDVRRIVPHGDEGRVILARGAAYLLREDHVQALPADTLEPLGDVWAAPSGEVFAVSGNRVLALGRHALEALQDPVEREIEERRRQRQAARAALEERALTTQARSNVGRVRIFHHLRPDPEIVRAMEPSMASHPSLRRVVHDVCVDGSVLYFVDGRSRLFSMPLGGGEPTLVADNTSFGACAEGKVYYRREKSVIVRDASGATRPLLELSGEEPLSVTIGRGAILVREFRRPHLYVVPKNRPDAVRRIRTGSSSAVDDGRWVYWTEYGTGRVRRALLRGGSAQTIARGQARPIAIAVHEDHVYWGNERDQTIRRAPKAGGRVEIIARNQLNHDLFYVHGDALYWFSWNDDAPDGHTVARLDLGGQGGATGALPEPTTIATHLRGPSALAFHANRVFIANKGESHILELTLPD